MLLRRKIIQITLLAITIITVWTSSNINWGKERWTRIIKVDGNGYYAYLPAVFIYRDLQFGFFDEIAAKEGCQNMGYEYRYTIDNRIVNKYFAGTAAAQLPFFLAAHLLSYITGEPMDGYSVYYLVFINLASIFYLLLGSYFLNKVLARYSINPFNRAIVLAATVFGTNLFYYTVYEPSMSHVYSFAFINMFIYCVIVYVENLSTRHLFFSGILLGMIFLIRPANLLILAAVPFIAGDAMALKRAVLTSFQRWRSSFFAILLFLIPVTIQAFIYKAQTGNYWVYSYGDEQFDLGRPHMLEMLFSYRKGLFVYTPLWFLSLAGLIYVFRKNRWQGIAWLTFFLILTWVLSSWHQWYYGGSFSSRVYIEYYALFAILLGTLLQHFKKNIPRSVLISIIGLLVLYSVIQTYQYYAGIIHWSDMTRELYWEVFLKFG